MALPKKQVRERVQNVDVNDEASVESLVKWILDGASASRDAIQEQLDEAKTRITELENEATTKAADYDKLVNEHNALQKDYDALKATSGDAQKVQEQFDAYKAEIAAKETAAAWDTAVRKSIKESGVGREAFVDLLVKQVDRNAVEVENGAVKDNSFINSLKQQFGDCWTATQTGGVKDVKPATSGSKTTMTINEIASIKDREARHKAIAENAELFNS